MNHSRGPNMRLMVFIVFCIWTALCLVAYLWAQSEKRNVRVIDYFERDKAKILRQNVPDRVTEVKWLGPLRKLGKVLSNSAGAKGRAAD